jgi:hemoglobin
MNDEIWVDPRRVAAVVYDVGVAVDHLLFVFARELAAEGIRVGGLALLPRSEPGCGPNAPMLLHDVATGEAFSPCDVGPDARECRLDHGLQQQAAARIRAAMEGAADLVLVPRFGREEARGEGFHDEVVRAVQNNCRVLMAVPRGLTESWLALTSGIGTLLDARLWVLRDWWKEFGIESPDRRQGCRSGPGAGSIQVGESVRWVQAVQEFELPAVPFPSRRIFDVAGEACLRDLVRHHHDDVRKTSIAGLFPEGDLAFEQVVARVADYVVEACGGPARFTPAHGSTCMRARHYPFTIDEKSRETWLLCLWRAFDQADFPKVLRREYWEWMEAFSVRMINRRTMRAQPARLPFEAMLARE